jgi:YgiT-type zinc finger domain-containing protein
MLKITKCPSCGSSEIRRIRRDWSDEYQGIAYVVPDLEYYECPECGERVYDQNAMRKIESHSPAFKRARPQKRRLA